MLGADAGIIQPGADGMRFDHLSLFALQQIGSRSVQHPDASRGDRRRGRVHVSIPSPAASTPHKRTSGSSMNPAKMPIALLPPPTHATTSLGKRPYFLEHWRALRRR